VQRLYQEEMSLLYSGLAESDRYGEATANGGFTVPLNIQYFEKYDYWSLKNK
jgi:hypothetical protein